MFEGLDPAVLAIWYVAFLFSTTAHEAAHALVARWGGDDTALRAGQVTLNPAPHIAREPFGMVLVPLLAFASAGWMIGWASAPYDPVWAERHPRRAAAMAAAGPAANFLIVISAVIGLRILVMSGVCIVPEGELALDRLVVAAAPESIWLWVGRFLSVLASLNLLLGVFNLFPLPPLDGAAVVEGLGTSRIRAAMAGFRAMPGAGLFGLLAAWMIFPKIYFKLFLLLVLIVHPGTDFEVF